MRLNRLVVAGAVVAIVLAISSAMSAKDVVLPSPDLDDTLADTPAQVSAVIAGGCFWGIEEVYQHVRGVVTAVSGYSGGPQKYAKYDLVSSGTTGHAESVKVVYDPSQITYGQLLKVFFSVAHDPTQRGGQGPDTGPQYRSVIFYGSDRQQAVARAYMDQLRDARVFGKKDITTQLVPLTAFYEAEAYHQDFAAHNPYHPYIMMWDRPKVDALKKQFPQLYVK
ncbi:MAG TPA: peptide-methionine (S)-S-oxide reductase MsrA [Vicinamibacterales bacterium]|nr:peptide-methionine (S)-S-oxide reductase MsrA [Vicinamibacterales bacterium]